MMVTRALKLLRGELSGALVQVDIGLLLFYWLEEPSSRFFLGSEGERTQARLE